MNWNYTTINHDTRFNFDFQVDYLRFSNIEKNNQFPLAVSTSSLTTSEWKGQVFVLTIDPLKKLFTLKRKIELAFGSACNDWIEDRILIIGDDDGSIQLVLLEAKKEKVIKTLNEHEDIISAIKLNSKYKNLFLSGSWDSNIKLWNYESLDSSVSTFSGHSGNILDLEWHPNQPELFVSVARDRDEQVLKIWDQRKKQQVSTVQSPISFTSVSWDFFDSNFISVGGRDGIIRIYDIRNITSSIISKKIHKSNIGTIKYSPYQANILVTGSDDQSISKLTIEENQISIQKTLKEHQQFVKSIGWFPKQNDNVSVVSGSWDKSIKLHSI